jgi:hypothetical protein
MILPAKLVSTAKPGSPAIKSAATSGAQLELVPVGMLYFRNAPIRQVIMVHADLKGCKLDDTEPLPTAVNGTISFRNQTPLTKEECDYALDTLLGWAGLKLVSAGDHLVRVVPVPDTSR